MKTWRKLSKKEIADRIDQALKTNINYYEQNVLGLPASHLDSEVFPNDMPFLKDAPYISTFVNNPNHIGCHTLSTSLEEFKGTQQIEKELLEICATDILKGAPQQQDGYITSGGTEANLQAIWIYRNYFIQECHATPHEICLICSEDTHYSIDKASNIFSIDLIKLPVIDETREIDKNKFANIVAQSKKNGKRYFIVVANMMTTMFGSVDDCDLFVEVLNEQDCTFKIHVDGAFGGFFYPFSQKEGTLNFKNPHITSVSLDAHKMLRAPYGTGIFLIRKGYMQYTKTEQATYINGEDHTLIGSRSGANAIAIWMILVSNGPFGWQEKIFVLLKRTQWLCDQLDELKIKYYRHPQSNIITIKSSYVDEKTAKEFDLVPDNHISPNWFKIVIMGHVNIENLIPLVDRLRKK